MPRLSIDSSIIKQLGRNNKWTNSQLPPIKPHKRVRVWYKPPSFKQAFKPILIEPNPLSYPEYGCVSTCPRTSSYRALPAEILPFSPKKPFISENSRLKEILMADNCYVLNTQINDTDTLGATLLYAYLKVLQGNSPIAILCIPREEVLFPYAQMLEKFINACKGAGINNVKAVYAKNENISDFVNQIMQILTSGHISIFDDKKQNLIINYFDFPANHYPFIEKINGEVVKSTKELPGSFDRAILTIFDHHNAESLFDRREKEINPEVSINKDDLAQPSCINLLIEIFGQEIIEKAFWDIDERYKELRDQTLEVVRQGIITDWKARGLGTEMFLTMVESLEKYPVIVKIFGPKFETLYNKIIKPINQKILDVANGGQTQKFNLKEKLETHNLQEFSPPSSLSDNCQKVLVNATNKVVENLSKTIPNFSSKSDLTRLVESKLKILHAYIMKEGCKIYETTDQASVPAMNLAGVFASKEGKAYIEQLDIFNSLRNSKNPYQLQSYLQPVINLQKVFSNHEEEIFSWLKSSLIQEALESNLSPCPDQMIFAAFPEQGNVVELIRAAQTLGVTQTEVKRHVTGISYKKWGNFVVAWPSSSGETAVGANFGQGLTLRSNWGGTLQLTPEEVKENFKKCFGEGVNVGSAGTRLAGSIKSSFSYEEVVKKMKAAIFGE